MRNPIAPALLAFLCNTLATAQEEGGVKFKGGQGFYEFGRIVKGVELAIDTIDNAWMQRFGGTFDMEAARGEHLSLHLGAGSIFWHSIPAISTSSASKVFYGDAILTKAYMNFGFGDKDNPFLAGKLGYFPVKYSNSRNLGEYLFRTGTYPGYVVTGNGYTAVNASSATVLGTQWSYFTSSGFSHEFFFTSERQTYPLHDFSLTYLTKYSGEFVNVGLGIQFDRLIPVTPSVTTPKTTKNGVFHYQNRQYSANPDYYRLKAKAAYLNNDSALGDLYTADYRLIDSLTVFWEDNPGTRPPMEWLTFKGIKPLAMLAFDFKSLFGGEIFRNDEMILYTEAVLMGWKNQPIYYENRMDRLVMMAGINLPTFGLLDNLNLEVERWTSPYANGYTNAREGNVPLPDFSYSPLTGYDPKDWKDDNFKWSIFLNRRIIDGFYLQAQAASDHLRGRRSNRVVSENSLLVDKSNWYYAFRLQASL